MCARAFGTALCVMGLIEMYAVVYPKYPNAPADVMPAQPAGIVLPAPSVAPPGTTNPSSRARFDDDDVAS